MLLAHQLYDLLAGGEATDGDPTLLALDRAIDEVSDALQAVWDSLDRYERIVLVALAEGQAPTGPVVAREHGVGRSTLHKALERLTEAEQHVMRRDGAPVLLNPLLGEWLRRR